MPVWNKWNQLCLICLVCVEVIAVNGGVCMYTLSGVYCFISGFVCCLSEEIFAVLLLFIMHPFPCSLGMLSLFDWSFIQYLVSGIDLLVESTENNESQLVNITRLLIYRSKLLFRAYVLQTKICVIFWPVVTFLGFCHAWVSSFKMCSWKNLVKTRGREKSSSNFVTLTKFGAYLEESNTWTILSAIN